MRFTSYVGAALRVVVSLLSPVWGRLPTFPLSPATEDPEWQFTWVVSLLRDRSSRLWCRWTWSDRLALDTQGSVPLVARTTPGASRIAQ